MTFKALPMAGLFGTVFCFSLSGWRGELMQHAVWTVCRSCVRLPCKRLACITFAAKRDKMPVPQPTSRTTLSLKRNSFCMMAAW